MKELVERGILEQVLARIRRRIFVTTACHRMARLALPGLPLCALLIAVDQRWNHGVFSFWYLGLSTLGILSVSFLMSWLRLGLEVDSALAFDEGAQLRDRVSSAWEFLEQPHLEEAQLVQVRDAIRRVEGLDTKKVLGFHWPKWAGTLPVMGLLIVLSFLIPAVSPANLKANQDATKLAQLRQLEELKEELQSKKELPKELAEVLKKLEAMQQLFEKGEMGEREVMLQLGRMDEVLKVKVAEMGLDKLESEIRTMIPDLSASAATLDAAKALEEKNLEKAIEELKEVAKEVKEDKLTKDEKQQLAAHLAAASAKMEKSPSANSFSGDLSQAAEALETGDNQGFSAAMNGVGDKLGQVMRGQGIRSAANQIGLAKAGLGQGGSGQMGMGQGQGQGSSPGTGPGSGTGIAPGGTQAGTGSGNPLGDPSRLADGVRQMLQIAGQVGKGPMSTEKTVTDGQMSQSQVSAKDIQATFAAIAEEVIEKEDIPLSQRYHVKKYFQAIRPKE